MAENIENNGCSQRDSADNYPNTQGWYFFT